MQIINTLNLNQARKQIQELKKQKKLVIVQAQDTEFNRKILENKDIDILLSPEIHNRKDSLKQRDSGLNEILCKIAAKNNIKIGINIKEIQKLEKKQKAIVFARIMQNIQLCKRTKTQMVFIPPIKKQDVLSFLQLSGASTQQASLAYQKNNMQPHLKRMI
jgi:ribonuclease P/MRP protein subunit RPP1